MRLHSKEHWTFFAIFRGCKRQTLEKKCSRERKSLFVNEDKSNASILHAIVISLTKTIWTIPPEKGDHLTPHLWQNLVFPLGTLCNHNVYLCLSWTQMLKKVEDITKISCTDKSHGSGLKGSIILTNRAKESWQTSSHNIKLLCGWKMFESQCEVKCSQ